MEKIGQQEEKTQENKYEDVAPAVHFQRFQGQQQDQHGDAGIAP
ncbi:hypothetical protein JaAD80_28550 [Janthinobacterium sp. AD80]|nr:hypothetical protein JaAD80_28550 [Janthinobacterium sp. AD80]